MNKETIFLLRNNKILINDISNLMNLIRKGEYEKIDFLSIKNLIKDYDNLDEKLKQQLNPHLSKIVDILMNKDKINNTTLNIAYDNCEKIISLVNLNSKSYKKNPGEVLREKIDKINQRNLLNEETQQMHAQYIVDLAYLRLCLNKNGERVFTDAWLTEKIKTSNGLKEISDIANMIRTKGIYEPDHETKERGLR